MNDEEFVRNIFDLNKREVKISYRELNDESGNCMVCEKELETVRTMYIHRHDGGNEEEYRMTIDMNKSTHINDKICCNNCLTQKILDKLR